MTVARVIPLQRLPAQRPWFDYAIPAGLTVRVGDLVAITFRRHDMLGIVWEMTDAPADASMLPIESVISAAPMVSPWQAKMLAHVAGVHCVSLGTLLKSAIPDLPKRPPRAQPPEPAAAPALPPAPPPEGATWWYRDRRQALAWLLHRTAEPGHHVIIAPTIDDITDIAGLLQSAGRSVLTVHSRRTPGQYAAAYMRILQGDIPVVIGTARALLLPFPAAPRVVIDQEEHHGHLGGDHHPRLDPKLMSTGMLPDLCVTTPAPSLRWAAKATIAPPPPLTTRIIGDLTGRHDLPWMSLELEAMLSAVPPDGSALLIVPDRGIATGVTCNDCHASVPCPYCGRHLAMQRTAAGVICRHCRAAVTLPAVCPSCRGSRLRLTGVSAERIVHALAPAYPSITADPAATRGIIVGTYASYRRLRQLHNPSGIALIAGDALLQYPDPFILERAWQFLARVHAEQPGIACIAQTYEPASDFWQRWKHGRDAAWYAEESQARQKHALPPFVDQWIAYRGGKDAVDSVAAALKELDRLAIDGLTALQLPALQKHSTYARKERILLTLGHGALRDVVPWVTLFPHPWQLETAVQSWSG